MLLIAGWGIIGSSDSPSDSSRDTLGDVASQAAPLDRDTVERCLTNAPGVSIITPFNGGPVLGLRIGSDDVAVTLYPATTNTDDMKAGLVDALKKSYIDVDERRYVTSRNAIIDFGRPPSGEAAEAVQKCVS